MEEEDTRLSSNYELTLVKIIKFLVAYWKKLIAFGLVGGVISTITVSFIEPEYEATALISMAKIPVISMAPFPLSAISSSTVTTDFISIEKPQVLMERLAIPSTYPSKIVNICSKEDPDVSAEQVATTLLTSRKIDLDDIIIVRIRKETPYLAKRCLTSIYHMIRDQQDSLIRPHKENLRKIVRKMEMRLLSLKKIKTVDGLEDSPSLESRVESMYLELQINSFHHTLSRMTSAKLLSPVYAKSEMSFPPPPLFSFFPGTIIGIILGILAIYLNLLLSAIKK